MLNRRVFLQRFGIGLASALALSALPKSAVEHLTTEQAAKRIASEFLRKRYNDYMRGRSISDMPVAMHVPVGLFEAFEGELAANERFTLATGYGEFDAIDTRRQLAFKATRLFPDGTMPKAWDVRFTPAVPQGVEYAMNTTGALHG